MLGYDGRLPLRLPLPPSLWFCLCPCFLLSMYGTPLNSPSRRDLAILTYFLLLTLGACHCDDLAMIIHELLQTFESLPQFDTVHCFITDVDGTTSELVNRPAASWVVSHSYVLPLERPA